MRCPSSTERRSIACGSAAWAATIRSGREIVVALVRVMRYLGASFGVLRKEKCTGDPVRRLGNDLLFQQLAEANLEALAQNRVKKIISICPHCVRTIQEDWKAYGTPPEVEHHSEFLARFVEQLPPVQDQEKDCVPRSVLSGALSRCLRGTAERCRAGRRTWSKRRASMSAVFAAAPAEGWCFSAKRRASA